MLRCRFNVTRLIVKEKVGLKLFKKFTFRQAAQEHGLVHLNVPLHQGANGAFVSGRTARRDQRRSDPDGWCLAIFQVNGLGWVLRSFWCPLFGLHDAKAVEKKSLRRSIHRKPEVQWVASPDGALLGGGLLMPLATCPAGTCCAADSMWPV